MRALVERDGAVGKQNVLGGRNGVLRAAEYGAYTRDKLHHAEGLCDVVVRAAVQTDDLVVLGVLRGQKDDRERGGVGQAAQTAQDGNAVLAGEHDVEQDEVGLFGPQGGEQRRAVGEAARLHAGVLQGIDNKLTNACIVLHAVDHLVSLLKMLIISGKRGDRRDCRKTIVFPTICVLTSQNTDVRKFPYGNFLPLKV